MIGYMDPEGILTTNSPGVYDIGSWLLKKRMLRRKQRRIAENCSETHATLHAENSVRGCGQVS